MKNKTKSKNQKSVSEHIIIAQSFYLFVFGLAGYMATSSVVAGFNALRNKDSAVAIITDSGIVTDQGDVSLEQVSSIINNFELISVCGLIFGFIITLATIIRIIRKSNNKTLSVRYIYAKRK